MAHADPTGRAVHARRQRTILGHPVGLFVLFLTQMWERFSYFGMLALLIIYLTRYMKFPPDQAATVSKWYTSLIYFTPLLGGYLADRFLGNKRAVILGATLMAVGHFLMTFSDIRAFYSALGFLVVGCGLLTPPLTSQVGLLYPPHDSRCDSGYTLFYMGINLGAFVSPLLCGWLVENTRGSFHSGFAVAGFGMLLALVTYLVGLPWIVELRADPANSAKDDSTTSQTPAPRGPASELPSALPLLNRAAPGLLAVVGGVVALGSLGAAAAGGIGVDSLVALLLVAICALIFAAIARAVQKGLRDQVLAILLLAIFAVVYLMGAGQGGNVINLWAEQNTNRYLSQPASTVELFPAAAESSGGEEEPANAASWTERWANMFRLVPSKQAPGPAQEGSWWASLWNPTPTAWFQSINPLLILLTAPFFAILWAWLGRRGMNPSIPTKMALGLMLMTMAFLVMIGAAKRESQTTTATYSGPQFPAPIVVNARGQICKYVYDLDGEKRIPYHAGRLFFDSSSRSIRCEGVFPDLTRDEIIQETAPPDFIKKIEQLQKQTQEAAAEGKAGWSTQVELAKTPAGFDLRYLGLGKETGNKEINFDPVTRKLTATVILDDKEMKGLRTAAGNFEFRNALNELMVKADQNRVSPGWLFGFFLLATLGEMCVSPVGLSMVSQLAPGRFVAILMSVWLLTWAFGNFLAGAFAEKWGTWAPEPYFVAVAVVLGAFTLLLVLLVRKIRALMHGAD